MAYITERLIIRNFAGIKHVDMEVSPFTTLIGPQSVGKSVTAKVIFYFKSTIVEVVNAAFIDSKPRSIEQYFRERFERLLPQPSKPSGKAKLSWIVGKHEFTLQFSGGSKQNWKVSIPDFLQKEYDYLVENIKNPKVSDEELGEKTSDFLFFKSRRLLKWKMLLRMKLGAHNARIPRFIPAGRSFYSQVERDPTSFYENASLDPFVSDFAKFLTRIKNNTAVHWTPAPKFKNGQAAHKLVQHLLSGDYIRKDRRDYIQVIDGRELPSALWSSGQQEVFPLAHLLLRYCEGNLNGDSLFPVPAECETRVAGKTLVCEERGRKMIFHKPKGKIALKICVDGCVLKQEPACDFVVIWGKEEHFIELKGKNVDRALEQLEATIIRLVDNTARRIIWCWVVSTETPGTQSKFQIRKEKFQKYFNARLTIRTNQGEHTLR